MNLIEQLQAATEGSRGLDRIITEALGADGNHPRYTTSVDAALTLMPEGWNWDASFDGGSYEVCLTLAGNGFLSDRGDDECWGKSKIYAIAICIAACKAREIENDRSRSHEGRA